MNMRCRTVSLLILEHESHSKMNEWSISLNSIDFSWIAWWVKVKEATEGHTNCHIQAIISTMAYYAFQCEVAVCALRILHGLWIACVWIEGGSCIDINIITCGRYKQNLSDINASNAAAAVNSRHRHENTQTFNLIVPLGSSREC